MKYWLMFLICFYFYTYGLLNHPTYYWKNPNITVKKIKITDKFGLLYYKNYEKDIERLSWYYQIKF